MAHLSIGNSVTAGEPPIHAETIFISAFVAGRPPKPEDAKNRIIASGYQNAITTREVTIGGYN